MTIGPSPPSVTVRTCLSKRSKKKQSRGSRASWFLNLPEQNETPCIEWGKHLNLITPVFVLHHLCHYPCIATAPSSILTSLRHRWVPSHIPCKIDPEFFGNEISSIAFVPVKHQIAVSVWIYCCLRARPGQDCLAVPLRVLKVDAESKPAGKVFKGGVIRAS